MKLYVKKAWKQKHAKMHENKMALKESKTVMETLLLA